MYKFLRCLSPKSRIENYFYLAILVYTFGEILYANDLYIPAEVLRLSSSITFFILILVNLNNVRNPHSLSYYLLLLWMVIITFMMLVASGRNSVFNAPIKRIIADIFLSPQFIPSLFPLTILMFRANRFLDIYYFKKLCLILAWAYILFYPFAFYNMITFDWTMDRQMWGDNTEGSYSDFFLNSSLGINYILPPITLLFWKKYLSKFEWYLILSTCIGALLIYLYTARRGLSFMLIISFVACWGVYLLYNKDKSKLKYFVPVLFLVLIGFNVYDTVANTFLETILERGFSDTRSGVEESFYKDVTGIEALIGRGWYGAYYEPVFGTHRREMETGYLALVLRGGWIYLVLYLSVLLYSAYLGLFYSKNLMAKSFSAIILLHIVDLYPHGWPSFSLYYMSIWIGVYFCLFKPYRRLTDRQVSRLFFHK